jgi:hypothetical protein
MAKNLLVPYMAHNLAIQATISLSRTLLHVIIWLATVLLWRNSRKNYIFLSIFLVPKLFTDLKTRRIGLSLNAAKKKKKKKKLYINPIKCLRSITYRKLFRVCGLCICNFLPETNNSDLGADLSSCFSFRDTETVFTGTSNPRVFRSCGLWFSILRNKFGLGADRSFLVSKINEPPSPWLNLRAILRSPDLPKISSWFPGIRKPVWRKLVYLFSTYKRTTQSLTTISILFIRLAAILTFVFERCME